MYLIRLGLFLAASLFAGQVAAQEQINVNEICSDAQVQASCQTTCAPACSDRTFLETNLDYCFDNGFTGLTSNPTSDESSCAGLFSPEADISNKGDQKADADSEDPCSGLETYSERRRCELTQLTPACSPTVVELEGRARLLVTEISLELNQYGELLERDWTDINNRDALCTFSIAQLDENYNVASENPELLRALQRQATDVQACQAEWEGWLRSNAGTQSSDDLINQLTRDAERQLGPLRERIANLGESVRKLETATDRIGEIIDVHIFFCDPNGSGLQGGN